MTATDRTIAALTVVAVVTAAARVYGHWTDGRGGWPR